LRFFERIGSHEESKTAAEQAAATQASQKDTGEAKAISCKEI
jgi:hypothetical protein